MLNENGTVFIVFLGQIIFNPEFFIFYFLLNQMINNEGITMNMEFSDMHGSRKFAFCLLSFRWLLEDILWQNDKVMKTQV